MSLLPLGMWVALAQVLQGTALYLVLVTGIICIQGKYLLLILFLKKSYRCPEHVLMCFHDKLALTEVSWVVR